MVILHLDRDWETTYSPEGSQTVNAPAAADYSAFLNESLQLYSYAESQGRKQS